MRQSKRLTTQQKESHGALWIFGDEAKTHDSLVKRAAISVRKYLQGKYTMLTFRHRAGISKAEINTVLHSIDKYLGQTLFVNDAG